MKKVDIESMIFAKDNEFSVKTMVHIHRLFEKFGFNVENVVNTVKSVINK